VAEYSPPAGWYDDPATLGMLRYWEGSQWTEHRAPGSVGTRPAATSGLPAIGTWLGATRDVIKRCLAVAGFAALSVVVISGVMGLIFGALSEGVVYANGEWSGSPGKNLLILVAVAIPVFVAATWANMAVVDQFYYANLRTERTFGQSCDAATLALPRAIGWTVAAMGAVVGGFAMLSLLALAGARSVAILIVVAMVFGSLWLFVRLVFMVPALVIPVEGRNALQASSEVSLRRFWPTVGRLLVMWSVTFVISIVISFITALVAGSAIDISETDVDDYIIIDDATGELLYFDVDGMVDALDLSGITLAVLSLPSAVISAVWLSATTVLFAHTHPRPRDLADRPTVG